MTAPLADVMSGVASTDLLHVTEGAVGAAVISAIIGLIVLRLLAQRSVGIQIAMVSLVTVVALLLSIGDIAFLMLSVGDRKVMLELMGIAGLAGLAVALVIGRRLTKASRKLLGAVREVGDSGIYTPPNWPGCLKAWPRPTTSSARHEPVSRPSRPAVASSSPGSATTCVPRWPGCGRWPRRSKTRW